MIVYHGGRYLIGIFWNSILITDVVGYDTSLLITGNCDLSYMPLLGNPNIANLKSMCDMTGQCDTSLLNSVYEVPLLPTTYINGYTTTY